MIGAALALSILLAAPGEGGAVVALPPLTYRMLATGPAGGVQPERGDSITVRYVGRPKDGTVFNTSADEGRGVTTFELNKLIPGWVGALRLMRPGDRWRMVIPAWLAYGAKGKPEHNIPPDAELTFDVELVSVRRAAP